MSPFADPAEIDALAGRIASHARATRHRAQRLGAASAAVRWNGPAARSFAASGDDLIGSLVRCAAGLDRAADALRQHAANVRRLLADLAALGHGIAGMGGDVRDVLHDDLHDPLATPGDVGRLAVDGAGVVGGGLRAAGDLIGI